LLGTKKSESIFSKKQPFCFIDFIAIEFYQNKKVTVTQKNNSKVKDSM
jgi:hypothetical protein